MPRRAKAVPLAPDCHFSRRPTFEDCDTIRRVLMENNGKLNRIDRVKEWRGPYQIDMMRTMCDNPQFIIQATPQTSGKTFCASLMTCARILNGQHGVWCYPTLRQGARIAFRRVDNWMRVLEEVYGVKRIMPDASFEKEWANGGNIIVLSLDEAAKKGVQGYTLEFGYFDEAHEITNPEEVVTEIVSRFDLAMLDQPDEPAFGMIGVLGVGTPKKNLLGYLRDTDKDYLLRQYDYRRIQDECPNTKALFEKKKRTLPRSKWEQFYELKDVSAGSRMMFPVLVNECAEVPTGPQYAIGVDVGKNTDWTVAMLIRRGASSIVEQTSTYTIEDVFTCPHGMTNDEQAKAIVEWGGKYKQRMIPGACTVELNGVGYALHEALQEYWPDCGGVHITDNARNLGLKSRLIDDLRISAQNACFAVRTGLVLNERGEDAYEHFAGLTYDVDEKGQITWEHSDYLSAAIMAIFGI